MMSVISMENNATKMKQKLMSNDPVKEETRSFLNFSRENLNISQAGLKQGFNRSRLMPSRNTILSSVALVIAVLCLILESWKWQYSASNEREIEVLKNDVDSLKHQFLEQRIIHQLKEFERQLFEISNEDDSDYDDDDDSDDYSDYEAPTSTSKSSDRSENKSVTLTSESNINILEDVLNTNHQEEFKKNATSAKDEQKLRFNRQEIGNSNSTKRKRDIVAGDTANMEYIEKNSKAKRFVSDHAVIDDSIVDTKKYQNNEQHQAKMTTLRMDSNASVENDREDDFGEDSTLYNEGLEEADGDGKTENTHLHNVAENGSDHHKLQNSKKSSRRLGRKLIRRNLRTPRQIRAIHYGADSTLFSVNDEHTGNGRARHSSGVFKAWRASDWVADLGMDRFFSLGTDGKLIVHESGLYLVYAQIHYLDEHDENGFHVLVNDRPVLQCMVFSPGNGHKSRSCFSGQLIVLHSGDHLILKDVGSARYTLFQHDKSFFGLVKLGEARHQSRQMPQVTHRENKTL